MCSWPLSIWNKPCIMLYCKHPLVHLSIFALRFCCFDAEVMVYYWSDTVSRNTKVYKWLSLYTCQMKKKQVQTKWKGMNVFSQIKYNMTSFVQFIEYCHCDSVHHCMSEKHCISNLNRSKVCWISAQILKQSSANSLEVTLRGELVIACSFPGFKILHRRHSNGLFYKGETVQCCNHSTNITKIV